MAPDRIESLISRMTVDEKVGQLSVFADMVRPFAPDVNPEANVRNAEQVLEQVRAGRVGSLFNGVGATLGREAGGFHFQADAQFQNRQHIAQRHHRRRIDPEPAGARRIQHKGADAMPGLHLPGRLQARVAGVEGVEGDGRRGAGSRICC